MQEQLGQFNAYRNADKPPKFMEKGTLEVLLFTFQSKIRAPNRVPYTQNKTQILITAVFSQDDTKWMVQKLNKQAEIDTVLGVAAVKPLRRRLFLLK